MPFANVAVNTPGAGRRTFSYSVPAELDEILAPGHAVIVPFGRRTYQGIVIERTAEPGVPKTRPIQTLIEDRPVVSPTLIALAQWIAARYLCTLYEAFLPMLPPAFQRRQSVIVRPTDKGLTTPVESLSPSQAEALEFIVAASETTADAVRDTLGSSASRTINALERSGYVETTEVWERPRITARYETFARLTVEPADAYEKARELRSAGAFRQADALEALAAQSAQDGVSLAEARRLSGAGQSAWESLIRRGLIETEEREVRRDPLASRAPPPSTGGPGLTPHQQDAVNQIGASLDGGHSGVFLLHGVTGSGKTEVYIRALERAVALNKKGIVLVPEIALTPQTVQRFWDRFPGRVAVLHSGLSLRERYDEWRNVLEGRFDVVIGSRSAALAPIRDVGLIVVDEEQEWTYKEEQAPRYHARDVAIERARLEGASVVLGSATPDVGSMHEALRGTYHLLELPGRITTTDTGGVTGWTERPLADVDVVDLREELRHGNRSIFSEPLQEALAAALPRGEQVILFVNRRGAGQAVQCRACGHTMRCRRCTSAMTYHQDGAIVCHLCGQRRRSPERCPRCGRRTIRAIGVGTERVATDVQAFLPDARVIRWDRDAVREAGGHEPILATFMRHEADVLVGTQMIAKGLDLPRVTVVGVVNADMGLHVPDLRAAERNFQLLCQVAGRAGRGFAPGRVIIQTYDPDNDVVRAAATQDYRQFYLQESQFRQRMGYPPFARMARLICLHTSRREASAAAEQVARALRDEIRSRGLTETRVIGPAPAPIERLRGRYRWQILILAPDPTELLERVPPPPRWIVDIDPVTTL